MTRSRWLPLVLLAAGAAISGFTMLRGIGPFDEGLVLQAARRMESGQWPYRDFLWTYGPGHVALLAGFFKVFGTSLLWWRILRTLTDAAVALVVFALVRRDAGLRWALLSWLSTVCVMAQPTGPNPFAPALLFALGAVLAAARGRGAAAGGLVALAALWRPDFGVYAAAAAAAALLVETRRPRAMATFGGATLGGVALLYLPFAIAAGPGRLLDYVVARSLRDGDHWRLPFPVGYDGPLRGWPPGSLASDLKDVLGFYAPLAALVAVAAVVLLCLIRRRVPTPAVAGLLTLGAGAALYLVSRADEFHVAPLAVSVAALVPLAVAGAKREAAKAAGGGAAKVAAGVAVAALGLLLAYGASNRISQLGSPEPLARLHVPVADGVRARPADARALPRVVSLVQARVPPGEPIYVTSLRSDVVRVNNPLLYVLAERPNPLREDFGLQTSAAAQRSIVEGLERARPRAIVRWLDPDSARREPNRRGTPSSSRVLDAWLASRYRVLERTGPYAVLVPR